MASDKAFRDEENAFKKVKAILRDTATVFEKPAGAGTGFPDFGFTVTLPQGKVDLHIEYKNSSTAQMGSMRDWVFDGREFSTPDKNNNEKKDLLYIMNNTGVAIANGKRLLSDLQKYSHPDIKTLYSGTMTIIKEKIPRKIALQNFADKTRDYQVANIANADLGNGIIKHYKQKFKKSINQSRAKAHILIMMIKDEIWYVDTAGPVNNDTIKQIATLLGARNINKLSGLVANLECRIQPRSAELTKSKPASIDVMANFRLKGKPTGGTRI